MNTFPGCIATISEGLNNDFKQAMESIGMPKLYKEVLLIEAARQQYELGHNAMFRGMIVKGWEIMQHKWCREIGIQHNSRRWSIKLVGLLHSYSKLLWTTCNNILHGEELSKTIEIRRAKCRERIKILYKASRKNLSTNDKKLFLLPVQYRLKGSIAGISQWIDRAEMLFQAKQTKEDTTQQKVSMWWYPKSQKWKKQIPIEPG